MHNTLGSAGSNLMGPDQVPAPKRKPGSPLPPPELLAPDASIVACTPFSFAQMLSKIRQWSTGTIYDLQQPLVASVLQDASLQAAGA